MKNLIPGLILAATCTAATAEVSTMALISGTATGVPSDVTGCLILSSPVKVGLSANVSGSVYCSQADGVTPAMIMVGTCHTAGLTKSRQIKCSRTNVGTAEIPSYVFAPSSCTDADFADPANPLSVTYGGPSVYSGNTMTGGGLAENDLQEICVSDNVKTLVDTLAAAYIAAAQ